MRLHVIAHAGNQNHDGDISQANDVHLVLTDADGLDQHQVAPAGIEHRGDIGRGAGESAERAARGHAANECAGVAGVRLHADAIAKNRASGKWRGGIDGDDSDGLLALAVLCGQGIHQRAFSGSG